MDNLHSLASYLGEPYRIQRIDGEAVISRSIEGGNSIEVSGAFRKNGPYDIYVWDGSKRIVAIYSEVKGREILKDLLGYISISYRSPAGSYRVERGGKTE